MMRALLNGKSISVSEIYDELFDEGRRLDTRVVSQEMSVGYAANVPICATYAVTTNRLKICVAESPISVASMKRLEDRIEAVKQSLPEDIYVDTRKTSYNYFLTFYHKD
jgi:hypothetical protein